MGTDSGGRQAGFRFQPKVCDLGNTSTSLSLSLHLCHLRIERKSLGRPEDLPSTMLDKNQSSINQS